MEQINLSQHINVDDFVREVECDYKNEHYSVRDNGKVLRHASRSKRLRKYDNRWTFGNPNNNGYMIISSEVVHRIVATAFHGEPPTSQHVVDHIDTNRQNNRPENLRWLTKLENILNNPTTRKRIEFICGSIENFLKDPSILNDYVSEDPNFGWMRTVNREEAQISLQRITEWSKKKNSGTTPSGHRLGEWIFEESDSWSLEFKDSRFYSSKEFKKDIISPNQEDSGDVAAQTPNAVQRDWKTPSEFPCCPKEDSDNPIHSYFTNLRNGEVFSKNKYSSSIVLDFATSKDSETLWVMCKSDQDNAVKPWSLAQVTFENNLFVHANLGSFFEQFEAEKRFTLEQGLEWTRGDSVDDFA